jgi:Flp pilus assembly protein TadD
MSLLLDALKPTEPHSAEAVETHEEALDALETLALLSTKPSAIPPLTLEPAAEMAIVPPAEAAPEPVAEIVQAPSITDRVREAVVAPPSPMPPSSAPPAARPLDSAPAAAHSMKKYRLLLAALLALAGIALTGMFLWKPSPKAFSYPQRGEPQQPVPATDATPTPPSTNAVQVSSARPADQFAYQGDAPEIDLRETGGAAPASASPAAAAANSRATDAPAPVEPSGPARHAPRTAAETAHVAAPTLSVTRSMGLSPIDQHVQAGYRALAAGDIATAKNQYLTALALDPNNVDGLMGIGAVAARDGQAVVATAAYAKVLKLEPGNPDATAAMAMLRHDGTANESDESHLKILIAADGDRPALHAALAGVYAADGRWTEAAQEYFAALGKDPGNPDLAFNLAASLDQNRKTAMALKFYQQALVFAHQRPAQIDLRAIEQRIKQLNLRLAVKSSGTSGTP